MWCCVRSVQLLPISSAFVFRIPSWSLSRSIPISSSPSWSLSRSMPISSSPVSLSSWSRISHVSRLPSWSCSCIHSTVCLHKADDAVKDDTDEEDQGAEKCNFVPIRQNWESVSDEERRLSMVYPWLMLAEEKDMEEGSSSRSRRSFYSLSTQKEYLLELPEACDRRCWSSKGWLITLGLDLEIHLLNPFSPSRVQIPLSPPPTIPWRRIKKSFTPEERESLCRTSIYKVVLSSRPSLSDKTTLFEPDEDDKDCIVMVIYSESKKLAYLSLAYLRSKDERKYWTSKDEGKYWTSKDEGRWTRVADSRGINDVIYFNGQFYAIDSKGTLFICDISSSSPKLIEFAEAGEGLDERHKEDYMCDYHLVESQGKLFMVARKFDCNDANHPRDDFHYSEDEGDDDNKSSSSTKRVTTGFVVYKLDFGKKKWKEVNSVDNRALFLGNNASFAIFPSKQLLGVEPNSIYFTDSFPENLVGGAGHDMGVYGMQPYPGVLKSHYTGVFFSNFVSPYSPPLWICPSF